MTRRPSAAPSVAMSEGFRPTGVKSARVWLEDATTHEIRDADLHEVKLLPFTAVGEERDLS